MARECSPSWIDTYLKYTAGQRSPTAFHYWTSISVIAAALSRHVWIDRGYYTLYPNIYVILVAGSAKCSKSTATNLGMGILKKIKDPPMVFSQKITTEALIEALVTTKKDGCCTGIIHASELSVFMGIEAHKTGLIPVLTDLYDSPDIWTYTTRVRGNEKMENVTICFLGATTQEWLRMSIPASAIGGGFTSRIIFVYQDQQSNDKMFPSVTMSTEMYKVKLISDLNEIREIRGPFSIAPDAMEFAERWYAVEASKVRDPKLDGYYGRKHDSLLKVSMILSASESSNKSISLSHVKRALEILDENELKLDEVLAGVEASQSGTETGKVLDLILREGPIRQTEIIRRCWRMGTATVIQEHLRTLEEGGEIVASRGERNVLYYKIAPKKKRGQ